MNEKEQNDRLPSSDELDEIRALINGEKVRMDGQPENSEPKAEDAVRPDGEDGEPDNEREGVSYELYDWAQSMVTAIVFVVLLFTFFVRIIGVDGSSMVPTLYDKEMMVLLSAQFFTPEDGDVVVFSKESVLNGEPLVKRVIATAGQTVDINFVTHQVYVDGVLLDEPYIAAPTSLRGDVQFPVTVPEGCIFVMGDNRNESSDSRLSLVGMVDTRCIIGKVLYITFPFNRIGAVK